MQRIKLKTVEVIYGHRCNLSCRGCSSGSDFIKDTRYDPTLESIYKSIEDLSKYVDPESIDLIGGELFLYWDKVELIVKKIREYYPTTVICLLTNGLLIDKFKKQLVSLCETHHPCNVDITDHFTLFSSDVVAKKYHAKLDKFVENLAADKVSSIPLTLDVNWLKNNKNAVTSTNLHKLSSWAEIYHVKSNTVQVSRLADFKAGYFEVDGQIKPYATNDPAGSYANGCGMPHCHALVESKLYKCSWFFVLPYLLEIKGQLDDPDWQKYLKYKPLDLTNVTDAELDHFYTTSTRDIGLCDVCNNNQSTNIRQTKYNVIPIQNK